MANPTPIPPPRHARWQKGQSGNPGGATALPPELKAIKSLTQLEVCKLVSKYGRMTRAEVQVAAQAPEIPMIEMAIASIFVQAAKHGDYGRLAFLLDRAIGKPVATVPDEDGDLSAMPLAELLSLVKEHMPALEKEVGHCPGKEPA